MFEATIIYVRSMWGLGLFLWQMKTQMSQKIFRGVIKLRNYWQKLKINLLWGKLLNYTVVVHLKLYISKEIYSRSQLMLQWDLILRIFRNWEMQEYQATKGEIKNTFLKTKIMTFHILNGAFNPKWISMFLLLKTFSPWNWNSWKRAKACSIVTF